jgi:hypothetical protein
MILSNADKYTRQQNALTYLLNKGKITHATYYFRLWVLLLEKNSDLQLEVSKLTDKLEEIQTILKEAK